MEMLELRMTTDLATALPAEIGFNFEELEAALAYRVEHYNHMVVTEDSIQEAKADLANLRKLKEAIETRRKEVKKECAKPYNEFEAKIKKLVALIDAPVAAIDGQVKKFAEQEREQKLCEIEAAYNELVPETIREIIPLDRILDPKWLNKGTTMKSIRESLDKRAKRVDVDLLIIDGMDPNYKPAVRAKYIETLDIATAMHYKDEIIEAEERFRQQEEARAQRDAQRAARANQVPQAEEKPPVAALEPIREPAPQPTNGERLYTLHLELKLTRRQADALKKFLSDSGIQYTNMDK